MAYPPRPCFDGAIYHIAARGNNRETIFADEEDHRKYLELLGRYKRQLRFLLHAYVLMTNHVHLILEPSGQATVSRIMQGLGIAYTQWFNRRHARVGHVFQGRFRSRIIDQEPYLLAASRYVHLNPVRARLVRHPADYLWSSYSSYLTGQSPGQLVDTEMVLTLAAARPERQREEYQRLVESVWPADSAKQWACIQYEMQPSL